MGVPSRWSLRSRRVQAVLLLGVAGLGAAGAWRFWPRASGEFPRPPLPTAFPDCPEVPTKAYDWHGLKFRYPADMRLNVQDDAGSPQSDPSLAIAPVRNNELLAIFQSIGIVSFPPNGELSKIVESAWTRPAEELLRPGAIHAYRYATLRSVQPLRVDGHRAALFLHRGQDPISPKEHDAWWLVIAHPRADYQIGSPDLFNPYVLGQDMVVRRNDYEAEHNAKLACAYWTLLKSLQLP